jgi:hypothetical protein
VGVLLGTAAYMSPEQARGTPVDKRADIWAFGVVLCELVTGEQLFQGETITDVLVAVVRQEPEWERVPPKIRRLLRKCLEKDPKKRLRDIGDAAELHGGAAGARLRTGRAEFEAGISNRRMGRCGPAGSGSSHARVRAFSQACSGCGAHAPIHTSAEVPQLVGKFLADALTNPPTGATPASQAAPDLSAPLAKPRRSNSHDAL